MTLKVLLSQLRFTVQTTWSLTASNYILSLPYVGVVFYARLVWSFIVQPGTASLEPIAPNLMSHSLTNLIQ